jgi:hypothetical protein
LLTFREEFQDGINGVRDIASSPDGKELYVLGGEHGVVWQYLWPWGSQPTQMILRDLDRDSAHADRIICDKPG